MLLFFIFKIQRYKACGSDLTPCAEKTWPTLSDSLVASPAPQGVGGSVLPFVLSEDSLNVLTKHQIQEFLLNDGNGSVQKGSTKGLRALLFKEYSQGFLDGDVAKRLLEKVKTEIDKRDKVKKSSRPKSTRVGKPRGQYKRTLKSVESVQDPVYLWAKENLPPIGIGLTSEVFDEAIAMGIVFFNTYLRERIPLSDSGFLDCSHSSHSSHHIVDAFSAKALFYEDSKTLVEMNGVCLERNSYSKGVGNPVHNPATNTAVSRKRAEGWTCGLGGCIKPRAEEDSCCSECRDGINRRSQEVSVAE